MINNLCNSVTHARKFPTPEQVLIPTYHAMKRQGRVRLRAAGEDIPNYYLDTVQGFKIKFSKSLTAEEIAKVEERWSHKLIKENSDVTTCE